MTRQTVEIASKLYQMQDGARSLLGDRYAERMAELRKTIEIVMAKFKCNELAAALKICQANDDMGGFEVVFIMAAAAEMIEPTASRR